MSNEELKLVVLSMDDEEEVTVDMVEQVLLRLIVLGL